jgi:diphthine synthase
MLCLVGLGLKPSHITKEALEALKNSSEVFAENYTSNYSEGDIKWLEGEIGKPITMLGRQEVESGKILLQKSMQKKSIVSLAVFGNPMNATTHLQLLLDACEQKIPVKVIPGISIFEYVGFTGLDRYKFGRTTTIVFHEQDYEPESFYDVIVSNKKAGLHTLCLLDIKREENKLMEIKHALSILEMIEERRELNILGDSIIVGIAGAGSENQQFKAGTLESLKKYDFSKFPQSIIVCGKLNEKEMEGLKALCGL